MMPVAPRALALAVDDEQAMLEVYADTLHRLPLDVVTVDDPREALRRLGSDERFDIVVLDLRMPHIDGVALLEQIRARTPRLPVIVVTGYPSAASAERCRELGVQCYLRKPFDPEELLRQVRRALAPPGGPS